MLPGDVQNLTVYNISTSSISLSWVPPEGNSSSFLIQILGNPMFNLTTTSEFVDVEGLIPGNYYIFNVSSLVGESNIEGRSTSISTYTKPGDVQNLTLYNISTSSISLSWGPPEGNSSSFLIQILGNPMFNLTTNSEFIDVEGLIPGNYYIINVSSLVGESNVEGRSKSISTYTKPGEVINLTIVIITTSSVYLRWEPPEGNFSSYLVQIQDNSTFSIELQSTFVNIEDLIPGNYYTFLVSSTAGNNQIKSDNKIISAYTKPGDVQNLTVYNISTSSISLSWVPPEGNSSSFLIQILGNPMFNLITTSEFVDVEGLIPGNYYIINVSSLVGESNVEGRSTSIPTYTKPGDVQNLTVYNISTSSISMSWVPPEGNSSSFLIQILGNPMFNLSTTSEFVDVEGLIPGNYYIFNVSSLVGESNVEGRSKSISTYTKPGDVQNLTVYNISTSSISLSWVPPEGNSSSFLIQILGNPTFNLSTTFEFVDVEGLIPGNYYIINVSSLVGESNVRGRSKSISTYTSGIFMIM
ncbi:hypothetical protein GDO86_009984 [Hymenochirus boettgeri]|uniref:Fibronectin type-III domain-containing protein n=1 Tax=Hymenochirus boettgeri TaxID=247094 RepID=A0A8T2JIP7_9PIPI|nr:hypothetical protein GDO86_009984 [Hymenochirus boettgeri]